MHKPITEILKRLPGMKEMIQKARDEDLIFYQNYYGIRITPDELVLRMEDGLFQWGTVNWKLRSRAYYIAGLKNLMDHSKTDESILNRLKKIEAGS